MTSRHHWNMHSKINNRLKSNKSNCLLWNILIKLIVRENAAKDLIKGQGLLFTI